MPLLWVSVVQAEKESGALGKQEPSLDSWIQLEMQDIYASYSVRPHSGFPLLSYTLTKG